MQNKENWNECFNKIENYLKTNEILCQNIDKRKKYIALKEIFEKNSIDYNDGIEYFVELFAFLIDFYGYDIILKK